MSTTNPPTVSVVMPAFNAEKYLAFAVESILHQTYTDFELMVVDDGSTDSTGQLLQNYAQKDSRLVVIRHERNQGICHALNRGIKTARGKYIARMDADDWSYPHRLERQVDFMESHPEVVICGGVVEVCDEDLKVLNQRAYPTTDAEIRQKIFRLNPFAHPATTYRTAMARKVAGYNPKLRDVEDYDFYFRLGQLGRFANLSQTLLKLRTHPASISSKHISRQSRLNLYIRLKAVAEYDYRMGFLDKIFFALNLIAASVIPPRFRFRFYNFLRCSSII